MNKRYLIFIFPIILISIFIFLKSSYKNSTQVKHPEFSTLVTEHQETNITAEFKIVTNGTIRIFTDQKYHYQSKDVYLTPDKPNTIQIKKEGITWSDFFKTLPMSLDNKCLVTGTKQTFCTSELYILTFNINGSNDPKALNKKINKDDFLLVEYKKK